ncbi:anaerobic ribonucleoside-triphosphate reductase [Carnobacterium maltaromaticum]|uniref:anaerobic ribonucleoside-triphosphate reductase n=1 Tax=Carnobacterium maltaromaticum TaxID=2751 RepID=UPI000C777FD8|nr:anaerobic ribonucleoside-triphosphate reductase [Carnobacterium maltaromaticum]PLS33832.1 anaerobic ribonucleoside-triphosphate reductase [Carnobacterium maltaromaticum]PLS35813.1 anaerobic ribonucleoside-triphosphate reductase [Carnobacterium maltaromaticum]PLS36263.1 anaerobic ribonucleoside-triphosphate reductase [Carnobacterium maltaromaticum]PLS42720.1 anaerobic ribonucleoside-triphosphate reductase [Carnobacterium maltaromaticum]PLS42956.1 anaerobic ribonucleoside-triphosphate reducta
MVELTSNKLISDEDASKVLNLLVVKRDGRSVRFDDKKIYEALMKAEKEVNTGTALQTENEIKEIMDKINQEILARFTTDIKIYEIQNIVEHILLSEKKVELADRYINYRAIRDFERAQSTDINFTIEKLINKDRSVVNENANKDSEVFNTQRDLTAGIVGKSMGLKMLPPHVANAHQKGEIHYHDLDYQPYSPMTNCCLIDFKTMLTEGFKIGNAEVESPKSIQTAAAQMAQIIANVASSQYGGCSADRIDEVLAPFAELNYKKHLATAKEWIDGEERQLAFAKEKTEKDIYDSMQSLEYEINTLYSSQGQTPFTSLGFGLGTSWIEREIQQAILKVRIKGIGKEQRTAIFPKLIFTLKRGVNLNDTDPNYDLKKLALECATKRMYPDVLMYDKLVELTGSFKTPMGCRSFLQGWQDENGVDVSSGRMNLGVLTLNLPRIAMEANGDKERFWSLLNERLDICKDGLVYRVERVKEATPSNAPILYMHGAFGKRLNKTESVNELFKNRRATVSLGYIGLYEVATAFYGGTWEQNQEAKEFTLAILETMKKQTDAWSDEYDYHFSVYGTPSESLTDRFCRLDTEKFGLVKDITDKEYYTNSYHYDVRKNPTPFEKLEFEKDYPQFASGGFIHYCEYPNMRQNPKALEAVWDFAYDKIGYLGTNTPIDHCYKCDFDGDFEPTERGFECPQCGNHDPKTCDVVKRTCGYLGNPQARPMVHGRHKEISSRVKHMK